MKIGDITDESVFPNITHEELHFSMNKYSNNNNNNNVGNSGSSGGMMFGNILDESGS